MPGTTVTLLEAIGVGVLLGLSAGFAPGPLLTLVLSETLRHGVVAGVKVAIAPVLTDLPIVIASLLLVAAAADMDSVLGGLSLVGAAVVCAFGVEGLRAEPPEVEADDRDAGSLRRGVLVNILSPHPYLFWVTVGAPMVMRAAENGPIPAAGFIVGFYLLLIGSKVLVALVAARSRGWVRGRAYQLVLRLLGVALIGFAVVLAVDGLRLLGAF